MKVCANPAKAYMQLKKQNTLTVVNKNNAHIESVVISVTNATQLGYLEKALAGHEFTTDTENLSATVNVNSTGDFSFMNMGTSTVYVSNVEVIYEK